MKKAPGRRQGAALVEAAIVLPVLIILIGIAVDYSRIFYSSVTLSGSARNGALYEFDPLTATESRYTSYADAAQADATNLGTNVNYAKTTSTTVQGNNIAITVDSEFRTLSNWIILPQQRQVSRTIIVRQAQLVPDE